MPVAIVDDIRIWVAGRSSGTWMIVPTTVVDGRLQVEAIAPLIGATLADCRVDGRSVVILFPPSLPLAEDDGRALAEAVGNKFHGALVLVETEIRGAMRALTEGHLLRGSTSMDYDAAERSACYMAAAVIYHHCSLYDDDDLPYVRIEEAEHFADVVPRFDGQHWRASILRSGTASDV